MEKYITVFDYVLLPIYLGIIFVVANRYKKARINDDPTYAFFTKGLWYKIIGGLLFNLIYVYYYDGAGDVINYHKGAKALSNLFLKDPDIAWKIFKGDLSDWNWLFFDDNTGYPLVSYWRKPDSFAVCRFSSIFYILGFNRLLVATAILDTVLYIGIWKFYRMFCSFFPNNRKHLAIAILYFPSVVFWGSGVMKDTYTLSATLWFTYSFYMIVIERKKFLPNIIVIIVAIFILIIIKPYIFVALLPGLILWATFNQIQKIKSNAMRVIAGPALLVISIVGGLGGLSLFGEQLGDYGSFDKMVEKAQVTQDDLTRGEAYGENYYDIGEFDGTLGSMLSKAPLAIGAGLFRPYIWEAKNPVMMISGIENTFLIFFILYIFFKVGILRSIRWIRQSPLLTFSIIFSLFFAFSVGLATANFGALVRYKIPLLPFFVATLFILRSKYLDMKKEKRDQKMAEDVKKQAKLVKGETFSSSQ